MFDFRLKVFYTVAKRLSFTKAAADLFITQPAVTKHIQELEQYFKVPLFDRKGNKIELTKQGQVLLQYTDQLLGLYRNLEFDMSAFSNNQKGQLHLGASSTISQYVIPFALAEFHKKYRDVEVRLMNGNTEQIENALLHHDIDLGIIEGASKNKGIRYSEYVKDEIVLVCAATHPWAKKPYLTLAELKKVPLLVREAGSGTLDVIAHALKPHGLNFSQLTIEMELGSTEAIKTYLRNSECMAFLSVHSVFTELSNNSFRILDVKGLAIERFFYFIERQGGAEQLAQSFMRFALQYNLK
ncbi:LysR family transcriptional regulator [Paraflavisolibacter sp. H34]|uniref:LysR family transcriptional regulator n=1 Tax=Huijunlia imazamoxiresistens TaxID=3127457 RepID=UPI00301A152C